MCHALARFGRVQVLTRRTQHLALNRGEALAGKIVEEAARFTARNVTIAGMFNLGIPVLIVGEAVFESFPDLIVRSRVWIELDSKLLAISALTGGHRAEFLAFSAALPALHQEVALAR